METNSCACPPKLVETLLALVEARGRVVTKEQLMARLWPDSFVEESNLARNIYLLRKTLGKRPEGGEYIETISRRGYRFMGEVRVLNSGNGSVVSSLLEPNSLASRDQSAGRIDIRRRLGFGGVIVAALAIGLFILFRVRQQPPQLLKQFPITFNSSLMPVSSAALSPSGQYVAYTDPLGAHVRNINARTETSLPAPSGVSHLAIDGWFPDHSAVLATAWDSGQQCLWRIPVIGRRDPELLRKDIDFAAISTDGKFIVFTTGDQKTILLRRVNGGDVKTIANAPAGNKFVDLAWVPGSKRLETILQPSSVYDSMIETIDIRRRREKLIDPRGRATSLTVLSGGRTIYSKIGPPPFSYANLWSIRAGRAASQPQQITDWAATSISSLSSSADGQRIALVKEQDNKFIAAGDLTDNQTKLQNVRRITADDRNDFPHDWTPDSRAIIFESDRAGPWKIYRQTVGQSEAEPIASESGDENYPRMAPDVQWVLWMRSASVWSLRQSATLMRAPVSGGSAQEVANITNFGGFGCARGSGGRCIAGQTRPGQLVFRWLDPLKGLGDVFTALSVPAGQSIDWDLSPNGSRIALVEGNSGLIRIFALRSRAWTTVKVDGWPRLRSIAWRSDGEGWFVGAAAANGAALLEAGLDGGVHVLWKGQNKFVPYGVPSPDGRQLTFPEYSAMDRVWMLKNY